MPNLVLSRKKNEALVITAPSGERIRVVVVDVRGDKVRLGTEASERFTINRQEVQDAIDRDERRADREKPNA